MRLAHQVASFFREELIVDPVHRHRHMAASIDVSVKLAVEIDQEAFLVGAANRQQELHRFAGLEVAERFATLKRVRATALARGAIANRSARRGGDVSQTSRFSLDSAALRELGLPEFCKAHSICKRRDVRCIVAMDKPRIRPVEAFPIEQQDQTYICLRDPTGLAPEPILLGMGAYFIITLFDGRNDARDIQGAFVKRFGENAPARQAERSDRDARQGVLPRFAEIRRSRAPRARGVPSEPRTSGGSRGAVLRRRQAAELRKKRSRAFSRRPKVPASASRSAARARSPDSSRRTSIRAEAPPPTRMPMAQLKAYDAPELVIILGTSHYGAGPELFSATKKNYATPLGAVKTDARFHRAALGALSRRISSPMSCSIATSIRSSFRRCS